MSDVRLCALDDIEDGQSNGFAVERDGEAIAVIGVRVGDAVFAYVNSCPHIGAPLDFTPGQFLNLERTHIQCSTHGALFTIEDGACVAGPCNGQSLAALKTVVRHNEVFLVE